MAVTVAAAYRLEDLTRSCCKQILTLHGDEMPVTLRTVGLKGCELRDYSFLEALPNLHHLDVEMSGGTFDLRSLLTCSDLRTLHLAGFGIVTHVALVDLAVLRRQFISPKLRSLTCDLKKRGSSRVDLFPGVIGASSLTRELRVHLPLSASTSSTRDPAVTSGGVANAG
jgi:hypothetical protein